MSVQKASPEGVLLADILKPGGAAVLRSATGPGGPPCEHQQDDVTTVRRQLHGKSAGDLAG